MNLETLEPRIFAALRKADSELTSFQIASALGMEKERKLISAACKELTAAGKLERSGTAKGTRYDLKAGERPNPRPVAELIDMVAAHKAVLQAVNAGAGLRLSEVSKVSGIEPSVCKTLLIELLASETIKSHGARSQMRYYALNGELRTPKGKLSGDPMIEIHLRRAEESDAESSEPDEPPQVEKITSKTAVDREIESLPIGKPITPHDLAIRAINNWCDGGRYLPASDYVYSLIKRKDDRLYSGWESSEGRRIVVWRPRPGETRPDASALISLIAGKVQVRAPAASEPVS